jgi:hypothetical protein
MPTDHAVRRLLHQQASSPAAPCYRIARQVLGDLPVSRQSQIHPRSPHRPLGPSRYKELGWRAKPPQETGVESTATDF